MTPRRSPARAAVRRSRPRIADGRVPAAHPDRIAARGLTRAAGPGEYLPDGPARRGRRRARGPLPLHGRSEPAQVRLFDGPVRAQGVRATGRPAAGAEQLLGKAGIATRPQLAELDRRAAASGGVSDEARVRRARAVAAARYALSPQPRAPEEAVYEALHASRSLPVALEEARRRLH